MGNERQINAKRDRKYEFYTRREDIENELSHYGHHFKGKVVYCNCDDPAESEFWKFFQRNFKEWGLKKLIATHYDPNEQNFSYVLTLDEGAGWKDKPVKTPICCNGDFRSATCIEFLKQADIVVTNPPFGEMFRQYFDQLIEYNKRFLIMGSMEAITFKNVFPLLMSNRVWFGYNFNKTMAFRVPDGYKYNAKKTAEIDDGNHYGIVPEICWYTNLDIPKRYEYLDLRGTYYSPEKYLTYDNYDAIEIGEEKKNGVWRGDLSLIPCDYDGVMGVPITFMGVYNPNQFEIIGIAKRGPGDPSLRSHVYTKEEYSNYSDLNATPTIWYEGKLKNVYPRILIKRK